MRGADNAIVVSGNILKARHELEHAASSNVVLERGVICVERVHRKRVIWIPLFRQNMYKEWVGCFSII